VADHRPPPELTVRSLAVGLAVGSLLAAGNIYAGLVLGVVADAALTIVLVSFGVFAALASIARPLAAREANAGQVAGNSAAQMAVTAGLAGPIPALAMSGAAPNPVWVALWAAALGVLGTVLAAPLRRTFIEERSLPFPTGRATAELIGSLSGDAGDGGSQIRWLAAMAILAALVTAARDGAGWIPAAIALPLSIAGVPAAVYTLGVGLSPLLVGVGLLVGARIGASILGGALLAWAVIGPLLVARGEADASFEGLIGWLLWPGVAFMVSSSLASLAFGAPALWRRTSSPRTAAAAPRDRRAIAGGVACAALVIAIGWFGFGVQPLIGAAAVVLAVLFSVVAIRAMGETDTTPSGPLGGLTQIAVGAAAPGSANTLFAGGVTNGVSSHAATLMQGFCAGRILGSRPRALLVAQLLGIAFGTAAAVVAYHLLDRAYVIGSQVLPAPSALSWKATADVLAGGLAGMPRGAAIAAGIAAAAGVALSALERSRAGRFLPSPVALGIGFIVGVQSAVAIVAGVALLALARRRASGWSQTHTPAIASGLIAGESLCAILVAALVLAHVIG
jgi:uncharacterized oligopeptide transporter (OPT) family protein